MVISMKNKIVGVHPLVGKITTKDIINDIELIIEDYNFLERIITNKINLFKDDELLDFILDNNIANRLENISYILKSIL